MSWKDYQQNLGGNPRPSKFRNALLILGILAAAVFGSKMFFLRPHTVELSAKKNSPPSVADGSSSKGEKHGPKADDVAPILEMDSKDWKEREWRSIFRNHLDWKVLEHGLDKVYLTRDDKSWEVNLTVSEDLQEYIQSRLSRYDVDWGAVAVLDSSTGAVRALTSYSNRRSKKDLSLKAAFPAASVFKVITAAGAVTEENWSPQTKVRYHGDVRYVTKRAIRDGGPNSMALGDAFAKSANVVFGKIGSHVLKYKQLNEYARGFGFNEQIPFDMNLELSTLKMKDEPLDLAKTAAGLGLVTLSPVHGALISACIANHGKMMAPWIVDSVSEEGTLLRPYEFKARVWKNCVPSSSISRMKAMMRKTIDSGTARKSFRGYKRDKVLSKLKMGGKTGSKTNRTLGGWNEWFVGYAEQNEVKLAIGIVLVSDKYWKIKPARLARDIFRFYFSKDREKKEPKVIEIGALSK